MFANPCLGSLEYEATASAFVMAGIFLSFLVEYLGQMYMRHRIAKKAIGGHDADPVAAARTIAVLNIWVLEFGILFHSVRKLLLLGSLCHDSPCGRCHQRDR